MRIKQLKVFACAISLFLPFTAAPAQSESHITEQEAYEIGIESYIYLYPLVVMDATRRQALRVKPGESVGRGPMNTFASVRKFPSVDDVRPNFDTLFSVAWLDLTKGPVTVSVPDTGGRYYFLPMLDMWTDVFASLGKRTTGTGPSRFAVLPPGWKGKLPDGVQPINAPTPYVWVLGRTQANGPMDYEAVHKVQDGYTIVPLSQLSKDSQQELKEITDSSANLKVPPLTDVEDMTGGEFFAYAAELLKVNPPHITDQPIIARMRRIGIEPGKSFGIEKADPTLQRALKHIPAAVFITLQSKLSAILISRTVNGWQMNTDTIGVYGNNYLKRAVITGFGLGSNLPEDVVQMINVGDADGKPLIGTEKYVLRFNKNEVPPVNEMWSITLYNGEGYPATNILNRYSIGNRDELKYNADGSLDIYIQNESPGNEKEGNWLPAPKEDFNLTIRLYSPKFQVLDGRWKPPAVSRLQ